MKFKVNSLDDLKKNGPHFNVVLLCGHTGSGKTYIMNRIKKENDDDDDDRNNICINICQQVTTRPIRSDEEIENNVYEFLHKDIYNYLNYNNKLTARTNFNHNLYGTKIDTILPSNKDIMNINIITASAEAIDDFLDNYEEFIDTGIIIPIVVEVRNDKVPETLLKERNRDMEFVEKEKKSFINYNRLIINNKNFDRYYYLINILYTFFDEISNKKNISYHPKSFYDYGISLEKVEERTLVYVKGGDTEI